MKVGIKLFYSYSHRDEALRDELEVHLSLLQRQGFIDSWHDRSITAGSEWARNIDEQLVAADIILLLVSADFLASDYCYDIEMQRALERHHAGICRVIPIILRPVDWRNAPFGELQALPRDAKPVTTWTNTDEAWLNIAKSIRLIVEQLLKSSANADQPSRSTARTSSAIYQFYEVFLKSGVPGVTFVEPEEFDELKTSLAQPGRGIVIEGPTGVGKTTALKKAVEQLSSRLRKTHSSSNSNYGFPIEILSARNRDDIQRLKSLKSWHQGIIAIEDFHRLDTDFREELIDYLKYLADTEPVSKKLVVVGIPHCGEALVQSSFDVATRIDVFKFGKVKTELVVEVIKKGEQALNIEFDRKAEIALVAGGSLNVAQFLCFNICQREKILETQATTKLVECDIDAAVSRVMSDLARKFEESLRHFAALGGSRDSTCLDLLEELKQKEDGFLSLLQLQDVRPDIAPKIARFLSEDWMGRLYAEYPDCKNHLFFDPIVSGLAVDDPQLTFYLGRMSLSQLARNAGKSSIEAREQIFISYSHSDAKWLEELQVHLKPLTRKGTIAIWSDTNISPGAEWRREIESALTSAKVAVLLVSPNFLASHFIADNELPPLLESAQKGGLHIVWIPLSYSLYEETEIEKYQAAHPPNQPLDSLSSSERNRALVQICQKIKAIASATN